jgi:hypothetical protein
MLLMVSLLFYLGKDNLHRLQLKQSGNYVQRLCSLTDRRTSNGEPHDTVSPFDGTTLSKLSQT